MVVMSKELFSKIYGNVDCHLLLHPWNKSCLASSPTLYKDALIGSAKFYSIIYLAQILMRGKKMKNKNEWIKMGEYYVRSTLLGLLVTGMTANIGCILRWLNGNKFSYHTYLFLPCCLTGFLIYLEPAKRRGLVMNLFLNLFIEYWLNKFERSGFIQITKTHQTLLFMLGSALLFYMMRLEGDKKEKTLLFWLYTPEKVRKKTAESADICPHDGSCRKFIAKGYGMYFGIGLAITLARVILPKLRTPLQAISSIRFKHFKLALFFGSYIGIYRAVVCYLCRKQGFDSELYALPAGYLAGLSFIFSPSLGIAIGSITAAAKLYSTVLYEKKLIPTSIPLPELLYCLCHGTLFSARMLQSDICPTYILNLTKSVSNGRSELIYKNYIEILKKALEHQ